MPMYEYRCSDCGYMFELLVRKAETKVNCQKCGSRKVKKLLSSFSSRSDRCLTAGGT